MRKTFSLITFLLISLLLKAGEGMWLPVLLQQLNEKEMRDMGMRITAEDIYSVNHSSLKDAVVLFGGGCTGELVSDQGLLLTNHHCGYGSIQRQSSLEHDYLTDGFWAQSQAEELPNPGLSVTFLVRMEDVTKAVLQNVLPGMTERRRDSVTASNCKKIIEEAIKGTHYKGNIKPFYAGNQYYLFITETFTDIRLVGAPPSNIGKFGGDTDNWMWPRHTGDFSVFRIYAGKDNNPADYSKDNVPFKPKKYLNVSLKGVSEGDFTFIYGYPGTTQEYVPAAVVDMTVNHQNPIAIGLRQQRLDIIDRAMDQDRLVRIQYSAKAAGIANYWKKMIGESRGIRRLDAIDKKAAFEQEFSQWVVSDPGRKAAYGEILPRYNSIYKALNPKYDAYTYLAEGPLSIEIIRYAYSFSKLVEQSIQKPAGDSAVNALAKQLLAGAKGYFKNYNEAVDRQIFAAIMKTYCEKADPAYMPEIYLQNKKHYNGNYERWSEEVFTKSLFSSLEKVQSLLENYSRSDAKKIQKDPAFKIAAATYAYIRENLSGDIYRYNDQADSLQRIYMKAQMEFQPEKHFYPDANLTLRVAYGRVKGYEPADAVEYNWFSTLDGIIQKENPDIYDYVVDPRLKELNRNKDYGPYGDKDGSMHVTFIATNHTTGGNSGSPVLDADGNLVGINFDRCWEGTMSDLMYDPDQCRNITLDIRYCLFVIDKVAGAKRLVEEMTLIR
ncbi:MAG TPA: S46 family peptidase [Bacteroidales bacterium]|nr:S46 family peptidase [Bacteroidales bacterium]